MQGSLLEEVRRQVESSNLVALMEEAANRPPTKDESAVLDFHWIDTPDLVLPEHVLHNGMGNNRFPDYAAVEANNRRLGLAGELAVVDLERRRLLKEGKEKLSERVEHISQTKGDGFGYDILSFESNGKEKLIEVKTTRSRRETPFYVSRTELKVSQEHEDLYNLVRVFEFGKRPGWYGLHGPLSSSCSLAPTEFVAVPTSARRLNST